MSISKRSRAARRGWAQRGKLADHIVTVKITSPRKGKPRVTVRDIVVPAREGTRLAELKWLILKYKNDMPKKDRYAAQLMFVKGAEVTVATGPKTRARKTKLR
jgi:hypothetical protein